MLYLIGGLKLFKGIVLLLLAFALLKLINRNIADELESFAQKFFFDPNNEYLKKAVQKVAGLDARQLSYLSAGTFIYAAVFFIEGVGLLLQRTWAEYLTVVITSSFLPIEFYEVAKGFNPTKVMVIILNVAIVAYLVWRLYQERKCKKMNRA